MRTFLLSIFWMTNVGSAIQLIVITSACWFIFSGSYSFFELNVNVFITEIVPWLTWLKTFITAVLGNLGKWILTIPILVIAPLKIIGGTVIGLWAYSVAKRMPSDPAYA